MSKLTDIDALILANTSVFRAAQLLHLEEYGRYWQGPITHDAVPITTALPRNQDRAVSISGKTWRDMLPSLADVRLPFRAVCDEYETGTGRGYTIRIETVMTGKTWTKTFDFGPLGTASEWTEAVQMR